MEEQAPYGDDIIMPNNDIGVVLTVKEHELLCNLLVEIETHLKQDEHGLFRHTDDLNIVMGTQDMVDFKRASCKSCEMRIQKEVI